MRVIDCDAHVEESVESWQYLDPEYYLLRPIPVVFPEDTCFGTHNAAWVIDYKLRYFASNPTLMKRARDKGVSIPVQEMRDIKQRLAHMDELGIDVQVVFPSLWLGCLAENVELEAALARSYNQFMATQCGESGGRLQYVAIVPWRRPDLAVQEIRRVKKLGSVAGIFARGIEWDRPLTLPIIGRSSKKPRSKTCPSRCTWVTAPARPSAACSKACPGHSMTSSRRFTLWEKDSSAGRTSCTRFNRSWDLPS